MRLWPTKPPVKDWLLVTQQNPYRFRLCPSYEEALATVHVWAAQPGRKGGAIIIQKADKGPDDD